MRRIAIGVTTAVAIWFGSAVVAEAQTPTITPTGPLSVSSGASSSTYTANVYLPTPCVHKVRLWIYNGSTPIHYSETIVPNPGVSNSIFSKVAVHGQAPNSGDILTYTAKLWVGGVWYNAADLRLTVSGTRPTTKTRYQRSMSLTLHSLERDRRRE